MLVTFVVAALLPLHEPAPPLPDGLPADAHAPASPPDAPVTEATPSTAQGLVVVAPAPTDRASPAAARDSEGSACLALLKEGRRDEAQRCYAARAAAADAAAAGGTEESALLARELADLVSALELVPPTDLKLPAAEFPTALGGSGIIPTIRDPPDGGREFAFGELFLSGQAELIATSTLIGAYSAELVTLSLLSFGDPNRAISALNALLLLAPVAGGAAGLGVSLAGVLISKDLSTGDVHTMRALMLLGTFDSIMLPIDWMALGHSSGDAASIAFLSLGMLPIQALGVASGIGVAAFTDLHEGAGSLAISAGLWTSVLSILVADALGVFETSAQSGALLITAAANAGFIGGLVASQWLPMSRAQTWALDVGGGVGLLAGASIAVFSRAANPFIGYGTMAAGTAIGMGAGLAAAHYLPPLLGGLPEIVALAPIAIDGVDANDVVRGAVVVGRL